ncbi:aldo/keto reductase [Amycolatopsis solani]|uniref:aldo/keto reductase n=1 Tax=Amycolatopsis solani TaxID=3028615 RepID=UPI0025B156D2|nr:aldo/keto reductase [Amycolatopsis sp. MEP2-6]
MKYNFLGRSGLQVSALGLGTWATVGESIGHAHTVEIFQAAQEAGINHVDTAEAYAAGLAESEISASLDEIGWNRDDIVLATKLYWGIRPVVNWGETLNRKYLLRSVDGCLRRLNTDYIDILYCHRPDPHTPIDEVVFAMSDIVASGKAMYWGTSEWPAGSIRDAIDFAEKYGLRAPTVEQPELNLVWRSRYVQEYLPLHRDTALGLVTWSPLASGLLTGKYAGKTSGTERAFQTGMEWQRDRLLNGARDEVATFVELARDHAVEPSQLAIAWCLRREGVSSVLLGASSVEQLRINLRAQETAEVISDEVEKRLESIFVTDLERHE